MCWFLSHAMEKLICTDVEIPAVSLGDADRHVGFEFRWDGMALHQLSVSRAVPKELVEA